ncbi:MAG: hypothetical protein KDD40_05960, partial [Bdellovibrionales bacterium]|nr:hypothetical protein [Bdellovibrionales bacterium]
VQVGDPFFEKLLIESCLEVMAQDLVVAIQDMGAAGLTSSSFEMASKGGVGLKLELDKVPVRDSSITPEEILLSESQERMLLICEPSKFQRLQAVFKKWDLDAEVVGEIIKDKKVQLYWRGDLLTDIDPDLLVENAPKYERPYSQWNRVHSDQKWLEQLSPIQSVSEKLMSLTRDVRACSREWIYRQYDQRVGARTARGCSDSVGMIVLPQTQRVLAIALGHRPYLSQWDAAEGGKDAVFYPALEMCAKGFTPLAVTDCLNFGNPEKPEIMSEFVAAVENISEACKALDTPVISGNVSFYNETQGENIISTPATGVVGLKEQIEGIPSSQFLTEGAQIYLLRNLQLQISGQCRVSEMREIKGHGHIEFTEVSEFCQLVRTLSQVNGVEATRVSGKFGLAYALMRMCTDELGFAVNNGNFLGENENTQTWFTEQFYEVLFVVDKAYHLDFAKKWADMRKKTGKDQLWRMGEVTANTIQFGAEKPVAVKHYIQAYKEAWGQNFESMA